MSQGDKDDRYRSRKWWGLWIAIGLVILAKVVEGFAMLKWPQFTLGDLPWIIVGTYAAYAGFNVGTHFAAALNGKNNKPKKEKEK